MKEYLVWFDCCVVDEPIIKHITAKDYDECWDKAYVISRQSGLSEGNFDIYEKVVMM